MTQFHGSDLEKIEEIYGIPKEEIIGFGSNVNPLGLPESLKEYLSQHLDVLSSYPDREYRKLREALAAYTGADAKHILVGNGSTELICACIQALRPKEAVVLGPSYSEYERELRLAGSHIAYSDLKEEDEFRLDVEDLKGALAGRPDCSLLVLCNPNNPTSSAIPSGQMETLLDFCGAHGIWVMVDETYVEFAPSYQELTAIPLVARFPRLIVLRGVSKFWAAPGMRLGYALTKDAWLRSAISEHKNPWTVSSIAAAAGEHMFSDSSYIERTRALIDSERGRCLERLSSIEGLKPYPAFANFLLIRILKEDCSAHDLFEAAIRRRMMIRDCSDFHSLGKHYFRFCLLLPEQNTKLLDCIEEFIRG